MNGVSMKMNGLGWGAAAGIALLIAPTWSGAAVSVSPSGQPGYSIKVETPPGRGPAPSVSINYSGARNGVVGAGWTLSVGSQITRCAGIKAIDGMPGTVNFDVTDKLCLNGSRLIAIDSNGNPTTGLSTRDAEGMTSLPFKEFRVEADSRTRVRAYGVAGGTVESGPLYFQVWHADGGRSILGQAPADAGSRSVVYGTASIHASKAMTWLVSETIDRSGNGVRFFYDQPSFAVGMAIGTSDGSSSFGPDVSIKEIQYGPGNKVVFSYSDRPATAGARDETVYRANKSVTVRLLNAISTYVGAPSDLGNVTGAVHVRTTRLSYDTGSVSGRPRLKDVRTCSTPTGSKCLPATSFTYTEGGPVSYSEVPGINLPASLYVAGAGAYALDVDTDGKMDLLKVSTSGSPLNVIYRSIGNGQFSQMVDPVLANERLATEFLSDCRIDLLVRDFNGDGRPDIYRFVNKYEFSVGENPCPALVSALFLNTPTGFVKRSVTGFPQRYREWFPDFSYTDEGNSPYKGWGDAENFYFLDLNGDGILDVVYSRLGEKDYRAATFDLCPSQQCTQAFLGNGEGAFTEISTNLAPFPLVQKGYTGLGGSATFDMNGDGIADLLVTDPRGEIYSGNYPANTLLGDVAISRGDGNFDFKASPNRGAAILSANSVDYQGDGQSELRVTFGDLNSSGAAIYGLPDPTYALFPTPQWKDSTLSSGDRPTIGGGFPVSLDFNGDGRVDSLFLVPYYDPREGFERYYEAFMYVAKGEASNQDRAFNIPLNRLGSMGAGTGTGSYKRQMLIGNFTGKSQVEILSLGDASKGEANVLYTPNYPIPPDRLLTVREGVAGVTEITYQPAAGTDRVSIESNVDADQIAVPPSGVVVTSLSSPSGIPGQPSITDYSYAGQRFDKNGRGPQGFRIFKAQTDTPTGRKVTTVTRFAQRFPYTGMPMSSANVLASLASTEQGQVLSLKEYAYCDASSDAASRDALVVGSGLCPAVSSRIKRPYTRLSRSTGNDLDGSPLPSRTITSDVDVFGYTTAVTTVNLLNGQTYRNVESTTYLPDDTNCTSSTECRWWIGRPERVSVARSVPNVLPTTTAGNEPLASSTSGTVPNVPQGANPAVLSTILQLLLDD